MKQLDLSSLEKAAMVFAQVPQFLKEAQYLFQQLKQRTQ